MFNILFISIKINIYIYICSTLQQYHTKYEHISKLTMNYINYLYNKINNEYK